MGITKTIIESTNKNLSALGGLHLYDDLLQKSQLLEKFSSMLSHNSKDKKVHSSEILPREKLRTLILSFIAGGECLEDLDYLRQDPLFSEITDGGLASTTMGDFCRSLSTRQIEQLQNALLEQALMYRKVIFPNDKNFILTIDSTPHQQSGKKMEGLDFNYKKMWCLDSLNAYDQYGFAYGFDLRSGNTYSGNGAERFIYEIFKKLPNDWRKFFRADSAYSHRSVYNQLINADASFAIALKELSYLPLLEKYWHNIKWKRTKIEFFDSKDCEVANCLYPLKGLSEGKKYLRVVFIRAPKKQMQLELPFSKTANWSYYAIVTNMGQHEMDAEEVIEFYRGRSNAENFIRDQKYGFDLKHFPCKKLSANQVYGLAGIMAYNMMRLMSFTEDPSRGFFAKRARRMFVYLPCQVVKHARYLILRFNQQIKEVIEKTKIKLHTYFQVVCNDDFFLGKT